VRVGDSALQRQCQECGETYQYRIVDGGLVPMTHAQAARIDRAVSDMMAA
jgi:hypothetical protein